jgi:ankyrin repeat protein
MRSNSIFSQEFNKRQKRIIADHTKAAAEKQADIKAFVQNNGNIGVMKLMLESNTITDVDVKDSSWFYGTALMFQALEGTVEGMDFLIKRGAKVNLQNEDGYTALHFAIISMYTFGSRDNPEKVQLLLENGVDPTIQGIHADDDTSGPPDYTTAITLAQSYGLENSLKLFKKQADIRMFVENNGNIGLMEKMLNDKTITDVDVRDSTWFNSTALMWQAQHGTVDDMKFLISRGAKVNLKDVEGNTALRGAIYANDKEKVNLLLKSGADQDNIDDGILFAQHNDLPEMTKLLRELKPSLKTIIKGRAKVLQAEAQAKSANPYRDSADRIKSFVKNNGHIDMMQFYLKNGDISNVNIELDENGEQKTALMYASGIEGELRVMRFLLDEAKAAIDFQNKKGMTALHYAAGYDGKDNDNNQENKVKLLLEKGANRTLMDNSGRTPLSFAMIKGHRKIVELLRHHNIDINSELEQRMKGDMDNSIRLNHDWNIRRVDDVKKESLFHENPDLWQCKSCTYVNNSNTHPNKCSVCGADRPKILMSDSDDDDDDNAGNEFDHFYALKPDIKPDINLDIKPEAKITFDPNLADAEGNTALHRAVLNNNLVEVNTLLEQGADINLPNNKGETPFDLALNNPDHSLWMAMNAYGKKHSKVVSSNSNLNASAYNSNPNKITMSKLIGKKPPTQEEIIAKFVSGSESTMRDMLNKKEIVDVNVRSKNDGRTALMQQSLLLGTVGTMIFLLDNGADVNLKDNSGDTALHYALDVCDPDKVKFLLGKKIDVNAKNTNGETALDIAKKNGFNVCIPLLEKALQSSIQELRAARLAALDKKESVLPSQSEGQAPAAPIKAVTSPLGIRAARLAAYSKEEPALVSQSEGQALAVPISKARVSSVDSYENITKFVKNAGDTAAALASSSSSSSAASALASKPPPPPSSLLPSAAPISKARVSSVDSYENITKFVKNAGDTAAALASSSSSSSAASALASEPPQKGIEYISVEPGIRITPMYDPLNPFKRGHFKKKGGKTRKKIDTLIRRTPIKTIRKVNKNNKITRKKTKKTKKQKKIKKNK